MQVCTGMYRVLMPVDTNESRAVAQARYVAGLPDASDSVEAVVVHVFEHEEGPEHAGSDDDPETVESVSRVTGFFETRDIDCRTLGARGEPTSVILDYTDDLEPDSIALGGRKRSPAGKILFGSVTMDVLRNTEIPVVVAGTAPMDRVEKE